MSPTRERSLLYDDPVILDFQTFFNRDFPYGNTDLTTVQDQDISNALQSAYLNINPELYDSQQAYTNGFLLLAAHYLVMSLRASSQGVFGQYSFMLASKGAGSVSEGQAIPQKILDNPVYAMLCKTTYGASYLMYLLPQLVGQCFTVRGHTHS
jgi:hypothetical protein